MTEDFTKKIDSISGTFYEVQMQVNKLLESDQRWDLVSVTEAKGTYVAWLQFTPN